MYTDPTRLRATDPGHVKGNPVFVVPRRLQPRPRRGQRPQGALHRRARSATSRSSRSWSPPSNAFLDPIRERRAESSASPAWSRRSSPRAAAAPAREAERDPAPGPRRDGSELLPARARSMSMRCPGARTDGRACLSPAWPRLGRMAGQRPTSSPIYREILADLETPVSALPQARRRPRQLPAGERRGRRARRRATRSSRAGLERSLASTTTTPCYPEPRTARRELSYDDPLELIDRLVGARGRGAAARPAPLRRRRGRLS